MSREIKTITYRDVNWGWTSCTKVDVPEVGENRILSITTMKRSGGSLMTTVNCELAEGNFSSFAMYQDFRKVLVSEKVRVTEKACLAQHGQALAQIEELVQEAIAFYNKKVV